MKMMQEREERTLNFTYYFTIDAGRTKLAPKSRTSTWLLGPAEMIDDVTGRWKLL